MFDEPISINEVVSFFAIAGALIQVIFFLISFIVCIEELNLRKIHGGLILWSGQLC